MAITLQTQTIREAVRELQTTNNQELKLDLLVCFQSHHYINQPKQTNSLGWQILDSVIWLLNVSRIEIISFGNKIFGLR